MSFESLSYRFSFKIPEVPTRWLPLIHLYDPDLPLFPIYYFHVIRPGLEKGARPLVHDRAYGYVERISVGPKAGLEVVVVTNKDLDDPSNVEFVQPVVREIRERFGINDVVTLGDIQNAFSVPHTKTNAVLGEMWHRVVANAYGNMLPFGRLWDEVIGLVRFVASFHSQSGRKGELIQTHYFASRFGVRIQNGGSNPDIDFFLLPSRQDLFDPANPLADFPEFQKLLFVAKQFATNYCDSVNVSGLKFSRFKNPTGGQLDTEKLLKLLRANCIPHSHQPAAMEAFNAFGKGPQRTVIAFLLLHDLRSGNLDPSALTPSQCGSIYDGLNKTYQSPKVIQIYAQQCFGNPAAMPVDTWINTLLRWPLFVYPVGPSVSPYRDVFSVSGTLGKVERLLWVTSQARKVHSSACNDAIWCIKNGSNGKARGANPLACNICSDAIRNSCPTYAAIRTKTIAFNAKATHADFLIKTNDGNNTTTNQSFVCCTGFSIYATILDDYSGRDCPTGFAPFPASGHNGSPMTVEDFVKTY